MLITVRLLLHALLVLHVCHCDKKTFKLKQYLKSAKKNKLIRSLKEKNGKRWIPDYSSTYLPTLGDAYAGNYGPPQTGNYGQPQGANMNMNQEQYGYENIYKDQNKDPDPNYSPPNAEDLAYLSHGIGDFPGDMVAPNGVGMPQTMANPKPINSLNPANPPTLLQTAMEDAALNPSNMHKETHPNAKPEVNMPETSEQTVAPAGNKVLKVDPESKKIEAKPDKIESSKEEADSALSVAEKVSEKPIEGKTDSEKPVKAVKFEANENVKEKAEKDKSKDDKEIKESVKESETITKETGETDIDKDMTKEVATIGKETKSSSKGKNKSKTIEAAEPTKLIKLKNKTEKIIENVELTSTKGLVKSTKHKTETGARRQNWIDSSKFEAVGLPEDTGAPLSYDGSTPTSSSVATIEASDDDETVTPGRVKAKLVTSLKQALLQNVKAMMGNAAGKQSNELDDEGTSPEVDTKVDVTKEDEDYTQTLKEEAANVKEEAENNDIDMKAEKDPKQTETIASSTEATDDAVQNDVAEESEPNLLEQNLMKIDKKKLVHLLANLMRKRDQNGEGKHTSKATEAATLSKAESLNASKDTEAEIESSSDDKGEEYDKEIKVTSKQVEGTASEEPVHYQPKLSKVKHQQKAGARQHQYDPYAQIGLTDPQNGPNLHTGRHNLHKTAATEQQTKEESVALKAKEEKLKEQKTEDDVEDETTVTSTTKKDPKNIKETKADDEEARVEAQVEKERQELKKLKEEEKEEKEKETQLKAQNAALKLKQKDNNQPEEEEKEEQQQVEEDAVDSPKEEKQSKEEEQIKLKLKQQQQNIYHLVSPALVNAIAANLQKNNGDKTSLLGDDAPEDGKENDEAVVQIEDSKVEPTKESNEVPAKESNNLVKEVANKEDSSLVSNDAEEQSDASTDDKNTDSVSGDSASIESGADIQTILNHMKEKLNAVKASKQKTTLKDKSKHKKGVFDDAYAQIGSSDPNVNKRKSILEKRDRKHRQHKTHPTKRKD